MPSSPVEEIKARLDLAEVVSQSVQLRRSGRSLKGLCPFHAEKTPSFYVFPETGTWHCFGCGEGGDAFSYVMKRDKLEFVEALRELAARTGVPLPARRQQAQALEEHQRLYQILEASALYYQALLAQKVGRAGREYLGRRGVTAEMQQLFGLGFAPDAPGALQRYLAQKGFSVDEMVTAGVAGRGQRGDTFDLLRGRVIFPIRDGQGRVITLGGRAVAESLQPKYLNGPQSPLFDKSACLYALDLARPAIRQTGQVVVVEGYLDAIAAHQCGYQNVVATLGTAITEQHLLQLKRGGSEILLALDPDRAGQEAALRALQVANRALEDAAVPVPTPQGSIRYRPSMSSRVKIMLLPEGQDPDDLLHQDPTRWGELVATALPVVDFVLGGLPARHDLASAAGKAAAAEEGLPAIAELTDPVERAHYLQKLSALLQVDESVLAQRVRRRGAQRRSEAPSTRPAPADSLEEYVLALTGVSGLPEAVALEAADFRDASHRALFAALQARGSRVEDSDQFGLDLPPELGSAWARVRRHVTELGRLSADRLPAERERCALELRHRRLLDEHERLATLVQGEGEAETEVDARRAWLQRLGNLARELEAIERLKQQHGRIGSMMARYRRGAEVLRG